MTLGRAERSGATRAPAEVVRIKEISFDPPGRDIEGEYVEIHNDTADAVGMESWTLRDVKNHAFTFPDFELPAGSSARVWTKAGVNDEENLFWGRRGAVWNNEGDKAVLRDENGVDVARYAY